jgi:hypothetical protein
MLYLSRFQIIIGILFFTPILSWGQFNQMDHDKKHHYFGITGALNSSRLVIYKSADFIVNDTLKSVNTKNALGFNLGIMANLRLNKRFDLRIIPAMSFGEKNLIFKVHDFKASRDTLSKFNIQNIYIDLPIQIKLKSDRVKDFRMYMIGGGKYAYDLASLSKARKAEKLVKLFPNDFALELGAGFEFYFPMFILAPEIKITRGLNNLLVPDSKLIFSRGMEKLKTRAITFSLHIQG